MTRYAVCTGDTEIRLGGKRTTLTSDDLVRSFFSEDVIDYRDVSVHDTLDEARAAYAETTPRYSPQELRTVVGYNLRYSVVFIQLREYDDAGEIDRVEELECKTDGDYKVFVYRIRRDTSDGARDYLDDVYPTERDAQTAVDEYKFDDEDDDEPKDYTVTYTIIEEEA